MPVLRQQILRVLKNLHNGQFQGVPSSASKKNTAPVHWKYTDQKQKKIKNNEQQSPVK